MPLSWSYEIKTPARGAAIKMIWLAALCETSCRGCIHYVLNLTSDKSLTNFHSYTGIIHAEYVSQPDLDANIEEPGGISQFADVTTKNVFVSDDY